MKVGAKTPGAWNWLITGMQKKRSLFAASMAFS